MKPNARRRLLLVAAPLVAALIVGAPLVALFVLAARHPDNRAREQRFYAHSFDTVRQALLDTLPQLQTYGRRWRLMKVDESTLRAEVPVLVFTDDLTVALQEEKDGVLLTVTSQSRVGKSDLGENRRHIAQLLSALEARLASDK